VDLVDIQHLTQGANVIADADPHMNLMTGRADD
jgi:hypothetical protein